MSSVIKSVDALEGGTNADIIFVNTSASITYAITGGADAAHFVLGDYQVPSNAVRVSFVAPPDFEQPRDQGGDNTYEVEVTGTQGAETFVTLLKVRVVYDDVGGDPGTAGQLTLGEWTYGTSSLPGGHFSFLSPTTPGGPGSFSVSGDHDWYSFTSDGGGYRIVTVGASGMAFLGADGAGHAWFGSGSELDPLPQYAVLAPGVWHADVWGAAAGSSYAFQVVKSAPAIMGGSGDDTVSGGDIADTIYANPGNDSVRGGGGEDWVTGFSGNDTLNGEAGRDYLRGGDGADVLSGGDDADNTHGNAGADTVTGGAGDDWVVGGRDEDLLRGDGGFDVVLGNLGADTCEGGDGNDWIRGGQQEDVLVGGAGDDWMSGDRDNDTLTGGSGADIFNFFADAGRDRVTDFNVIEGDRVRLEPGSVYTAAQVGADVVVTVGSSQMTLVGVSLPGLGSSWIFVA